MSFRPQGPQQSPLTAKMSLTDFMRLPDPGSLPISPFAAVSIMAALCGRCLKHARASHSPDAKDNNDYGFWTQHYKIDETILTHSANLQEQFKITGGVTDPNIVLLNAMVHITTICLHEAAIAQAEKTTIPTTVTFESERRCEAAAMEIADMMNLVDPLHFPMVSYSLKPFLMSTERFKPDLMFFLPVTVEHLHDMVPIHGMQGLTSQVETLQDRF